MNSSTRGRFIGSSHFFRRRTQFFGFKRCRHGATHSGRFGHFAVREYDNPTAFDAHFAVPGGHVFEFAVWVPVTPVHVISYSTPAIVPSRTAWVSVVSVVGVSVAELHCERLRSALFQMRPLLFLWCTHYPQNGLFLCLPFLGTHALSAQRRWIPPMRKSRARSETSLRELTCGDSYSMFSSLVSCLASAGPTQLPSAPYQRRGTAQNCGGREEHRSLALFNQILSLMFSISSTALNRGLAGGFYLRDADAVPGASLTGARIRKDMAGTSWAAALALPAAISV